MILLRTYFFRLVAIALLAGSKISYAQVLLSIVNRANQPISGASVDVKNDQQRMFQQRTNVAGQVIIKEKQGGYTVNIVHPSYQYKSFVLNISGAKDTLKVYLDEKVNKLAEVLVDRPSAVKVLGESYYAPTVIDLKQLRNTSKTLVEALNLTPGLRIQQQGGMGSDINVIINGIDGKDVKVFVDEIPVYLLGRGFDLQNLALHMIERIETYKGLIPVQFGSDALGGVINIVTKKNEKNYLGMGYMFGSWNSHEVTVSSAGSPFKNKHIFATVDAVQRHSNNDYWMDDVDVVVDDLFNTIKGLAKRFNDRYDFTLAKVQLGIKDQRWADNIKLISSFTRTYKEWQHGITAINPWGEPFSREHTNGIALNWKKSDLHKGRWNIDATFGYNFEQTYFEDIAARVYFWDGSFAEKKNKGESGLYTQGRTPKTNQHIYYARENVFFDLGDRYKVNLNVLTTKRTLNGEDKAGTSTYKEDPFKVPQLLLNNFFGTALESRFLADRLITNTSIKHYYSKVKGVSFKINNEFDKFNSSTSSDIGFGQTFKGIVNSKLSIFPGYEYTVRQPDGREIFGDYITVSPNPNLRSAKSHNLNFKIQYRSSNRKLFTGLGVFHRSTKNKILLTSFSNALATYTNLFHTSTIGGEWFLEYRFHPRLDLNLNTTYLDSRLRAVDDSGIFTSEYIGARLPNTPYLFGNSQMSYTLYAGRKKSYVIRLLYTGSYVHDYFLTWAMNGIKTSKTIIPSQFVNDFSVLVYPIHEKWSLAVDCKNLGNTRVYDNFSVQKPGRSIYGKITYSIH